MEVVSLDKDRSGHQPSLGWNKMILLISLLLLSLSAWAGGQAEDPLAEADRLIEAKKYNEAITVLGRVLEDDADKLDAIQERMRLIIAVQKRFNELYSQLIERLYEEKDVEGSLELINRLLELDPNPNKATLEAIERARRGLIVVRNQNRFNEIMDLALMQIRAEEFYEAAQTYLPGFELHKNEFDEAGHGNIVVTAVESALSASLSAVERFGALKAPMEEDFRQLAALVESSVPGSLDPAIGSFFDLAASLEGLETASRQAGEMFASQNRIIKEQSSDNAEDYFLHYAEQLVLGRRDSDRREGAAAAIALALEHAFGRREDVLDRRAEELYASGVGLLAEGSLDEAKFRFVSSKPYFEALLELVYRRGTGERLNEGYPLDDNASLLLPAELPSFIRTQEKLRQALSYIPLIDQVAKIDLLRDVDEPPEQTTLARLSSGAGTAIETLDGMAETWAEYARILSAVDEPAALAAEAFLRLLAQTVSDSLAAYERVARIVLTDAGATVSEQREILNEGITVTYTATSAEGETSTGERVEKVPDRVLAALEVLRDTLTSMRESTERIRMETLEEDSSVRTPDVRQSLGALGAVQEETDALLEQIDALIRRANQDIIQAERFAREGRQILQDARTAFQRNRFEDARIGLRDAAEVFDESLTLMEDAEVRRLRDTVLPDLLAQINEAENRLVVAEVRRLIETAKGEYRDGEFMEAENTLVQAQNRWLDTHAEDNEEVLDWLALVRRAMNRTSGWEIFRTDPLYAEITQLLKFATEDFNRGILLQQQGEQAEARRAFQAARETLDTIRIPYPRLKAANVLRLRIERILSPEDFRSGLAAEKAEAARILASGSIPAIQEEFSDLTDYRQVVPDDRELARLIEEYEYALDIRIRPPSAAEIARSRELYGQAAAIYNRRDRALYPQAVEALNEALRLWPENRDAVVLKDRILIDTGGAKTEFLSSEDARRYERAERLTGEERYAEAYAIVQELLRNPRNRNYPPLLDLQELLERRLGF